MQYQRWYKDDDRGWTLDKCSENAEDFDTEEQELFNGFLSPKSDGSETNRLNGFMYVIQH